MKRVTYFEIDVPRCANTYGIAPCTASIPTTGSQQCVNCFSSCQDQANFVLTTETVRFAQPASYLPRSIDALPNIESVEHTPAVIGLGDNLGERASLKVEFLDSPHSDAGPGYDPYIDERSYNPWDQGTHWGKFRARYPYIQGSDCRLIRGDHTTSLASMETRHFVVESMEGPDMEGRFSIIAKDPLKKLDGSRAQSPLVNTGRLSVALNAVDEDVYLADLLPAGVGDDEYAETGYICIGGNEVMRFTRGGNDADTLLLLHFNDTDNDTTPTDSSSFGRSVTAAGNAHVEADEQELSIDGSDGAAEFDGTGDWFLVADSNDWSFAGDFTIDCWVRHDDAIGAVEPYCSHGTNATNQYWFGRTATGKLQFYVESSGVQLVTVTSATDVSTTTWTHVAVQRSGNQWILFIDGVRAGFETAEVTIPNYTSTFRIGGDHDSLSFDGYIAEFRVSQVARFNKFGFVTPLCIYDNDGDVFFIGERGDHGTTASEHDIGERVQQCTFYNGIDAALILADLIDTYGGIDPSLIPVEDWETETGAFLNAVYTAMIPEPTSVKQLVSEIIEQVGLIVWWSDDPAQVNMQVLRSVGSTADTIDENVILKDTLEFEDQPEKRASQVWTFFGQRNPTRPITEESNYRSAVATVDSETASQEATPAIKKIFSRWIALGGETAAEHLNDVLLARYRIAPRNFMFKLLTGGGFTAAPAIGYRLEASPLQDVLGDRDTIPIQVKSVKSHPEGETITAEEFQSSVPVGSLTTDVVTVPTSENNLNLEEIHDQTYPVAEAGDTVICYINSNVVIGSDSPGSPSFEVGTFAAGVTVIIINNGRIVGCGGDSGRGGDGGDRIGGEPGTSTEDGDNGQAGDDGGTAFYTRRTVSLVANEIWGGGGGGGGGGGAGYSSGSVGITAGGGGGGGGGAGRIQGTGSNGGNGGDPDGDSGNSGDNSETESGGQGGTGGDSTGAAGGGGNGGDGGNAGQDGDDGQDGDGNRGGNGGNGGDAGAAIDGNSHVTLGSWNGSSFTAGATGDEDIRGSQIN